ncbi:MAG: tetratricopeptide repeat protein [Cyclobacteriaceae bacterium]|nr:tetratricopeptide repeat protein [Cyclobacteriaceae bacterium]
MQKAYYLVTNLQSERATEALKKINTNELHKLYVQTLNETITILITEDHKGFLEIDERFKTRIKYLEGLPVSGEILFLLAELNLQRGFCYLNLGQELNAVMSIRKAYQLTADCLKKYPEFVPIKKTNGVLQVMVGSVPDKYKWFISLLGMKGSVSVGQKQLTELRNSKSSLSQEATILYFTIKGFINQEFETAAVGINTCLLEQPDNRLLLFIGVNMLIKDARSEEALALIHRIDIQNQGLPMHYIDYLRGEVLLQRGDYAKSIEAFQRFIKNYPSVSFKKDSYFKIGLGYWLLNDSKQAKSNFDKAKITGSDKAEPDKYAAKQLEESTYPNKKLLKARFSTDGGYYKEAASILHTITPHDLTNAKDQTEYYYRKARLAHRTGEISAAKIFYQQSIDMTKNNPWYFGANSALQLGYIAKDQKDYTKAKKYFELALSFPKHEYKNSIDTKARTELEWLTKIKA